ncbi:universal stress protein [Pseudoxanthomonas wuyuanensis]|uniref:Nucleotide-binding universal stress protein, UspA family n=1 Tax=Pseudoxanthomonas wuyuanensis TaxID=1073196 RepID=A0A286D7E1_9GAMM|nr:universal stress protein [Pseudoxanthomonas wuyuanensis]KAF1719044.1 universal stress protein [Pseudoxanthomonas wuyuanensis]SOD54582.1 Nucleotide-binding universal stress protein, UspA family [Pseudoxanthomonas wuyuanensis]
MSWSLATILATTDFSEAAEQAVERAAALARQHGARLHLLHSTDEGDWLARLIDHGRSSASRELWQKAADSALARLRQRLQADGLQAVETQVVTEPLYRCLGRIAQELDAGLLVMGAHGEGRVRRAVLGATADRVLRAGMVPVLLVRGKGDGGYLRVALATDFSAASRHAAQLGLALAPDASHYLLHANQLMLDRSLAFAHRSAEALEAYRSQAMAEAAKAMADFAASLGPAAAAAVRAPREGPAAQVLASFVLEAGIDLVALGTRPRARWEANLLGSTALFALTGLDCDVLLVPEPGAQRTD